MAQSKLTEKQKKEYLKNPNLCPFCKSENIHIEDRNFVDGNYMFQKIWCSACDRNYSETYRLTDVEAD